MSDPKEVQKSAGLPIEGVTILEGIGFLAESIRMLGLGRIEELTQIDSPLPHPERELPIIMTIPFPTASIGRKAVVHLIFSGPEDDQELGVFLRPEFTQALTVNDLWVASLGKAAENSFYQIDPYAAVSFGHGQAQTMTRPGPSYLIRPKELGADIARIAEDPQELPALLREIIKTLGDEETETSFRSVPALKKEGETTILEALSSLAVSTST